MISLPTLLRTAAGDSNNLQHLMRQATPSAQTHRNHRPRAWDAPSQVASMDDPKVFGPRLHTYSHATAIDDGILADYQLLIPTITDTDLRTALTDTDAHTGFGPTARRTSVLHLAVLKAMTEHDLRHVIVYFQQIADAADFARQFPHTLRTLPKNQRPSWAAELSVQSINGNHTPDQRQKIQDRFIAAHRGILTNAQVLGEGVDLPAVDAIVFADRTASVRRIVQALGRALRNPPTLDHKTASLVIPAYTPPDADPTDILGTPYEALWLVTAALRHHDQSIAARAPRKNAKRRLETDTHQLIARRFHFDFTLDADHIAQAMDLIAWPSDGATLSAPRRAGLAAALRYHAEHGHLRMPTDYEDAYGYRLGQFIDGQRTAYHQGTLTTEWITGLEDLGMIWDAHDTEDKHHARYTDPPLLPPDSRTSTPFVQRWGRPANARESMEVDGERIMIGPWLCKVRTKQNRRQLTHEQSQLMMKILKDKWDTTDHDPSEEDPGQLSEIS
ncbi:Helicase associated domain protein [Streptomyces sp. NPDC052196]|uniref:helicase associated domain-containing protein n=1 Tax=Streptomyces sp. NPDC052196 TaxID=3156691 RepID=UPI003440ABC7